MQIGFIGTGHMASSLIRRMSLNEDKILINNRTLDKALRLEGDYPDKVKVVSISDIMKSCSYVFIGVKPLDLNNVLTEIKKYNSESIIITMVAGVKLEEYPFDKVIRILPNTPVLVGEGLTFVSYKNISDDEKETFLRMMDITGKVIEIEEDKINLASTFSGSAPAYLNYFIDGLNKAAIRLGLDKDEAKDYILQMAKGTIMLDLYTKKDPVILAEEVCSPGGSTIAGVNKILESPFYDVLYEASKATFEKNNNMR